MSILAKHESSDLDPVKMDQIRQHCLFEYGRGRKITLYPLSSSACGFTESNFGRRNIQNDRPSVSDLHAFRIRITIQAEN
jgi:hypothetical protein